MGKSDKYEIVEGTNSIDFCRAVQRRIDAGWELVGGASISSTRTSMAYAQAMIYREPIGSGTDSGAEPKFIPRWDTWIIDHHAAGWIVVDKMADDLFLTAEGIPHVMHTVFPTREEAEAALQKWREKNKE